MKRLITLIIFITMIGIIMVLMSSCSVKVPMSLREAEKRRVLPNQKEKKYYHGTIVVYFGLTNHFKESNK